MNTTDFLIFFTSLFFAISVAFTKEQNLNPNNHSHLPIFTTPSGIQFVRTPESRFKFIHDFPYKPQYVSVCGLRMAYVDVGSPKKGTILLLHGEPDWGYLYRTMIPIFSHAGYRVVVPDLIGFGRSDKPMKQSVYTYNSHVSWMKQFMKALQLRNIHAFLQDWGGLIGLTIAADEPFRFDRLVLANTFLPNGTLIKGIPEFRVFAQQNLQFDAGFLLQSGSVRKIPEIEVEAYRAPFPSEIYKAGSRKFPLLVPITPTDPGLDRFLHVRRRLKSWKKPVLLQWGLKDPSLNLTFVEDFKNLLSGTEGQPHKFYPNANHFIQEDVGPQMAYRITRWLPKSTRPEL